MDNLLINAFISVAKAALIYTIPLTIVSFVFGLLIALAVVSIRLYGIAPLRVICKLYVIVIRGTPLLIQLFVIFYALPRIGIVLDSISSAIIGFSIHIGAYASEVLRASLESVPGELKETGLALGFSKKQSFWHILVPYAAYSAVPPLFNTLIDLAKSTSLASIILVPEIMRKAQEFAIVSNKFLLIYVEAALVYLIICLLLEWLQRHIEMKVKIEKT